VAVLLLLASTASVMMGETTLSYCFLYRTYHDDALLYDATEKMADAIVGSCWRLLGWRWGIRPRALHAVGATLWCDGRVIDGSEKIQ